MTRANIPRHEPKPQNQKLLEIRLNRLFGEKYIDKLIEAARIPDDLTDRTVLINGRDSRVITEGAARKLVSAVVIRYTRDIIMTQMSDEGRMAFCKAIVDLDVGIDLAYIDYADIPADSIE